MVGRYRDVRSASADHAQNRRKHASHRGDFPPVPIPRGWQCVVVPEQLVRAINQIDFQSVATPAQPYRIFYMCINRLRNADSLASPVARPDPSRLSPTRRR